MGNLHNMIENRTYLFCLEYHYDHKDKNVIVDYSDKYTKMIYGEDAYTQPAIYFKRLYNYNKEEALKMLEDNIKYCENKLAEKINEKENANLKKRRRK